jgi:hypothetical protein
LEPWKEESTEAVTKSRVGGDRLALGGRTAVGKNCGRIPARVEGLEQVETN